MRFKEKMTAIHWQQVLKRSVILLIWMVLWQGFRDYTGLGMFFPGPVQVLETLFQLMKKALFYETIVRSFTNIFLGFIIALLAGCIIGMLCGHILLLKDFFEPVIQLMKTVPVTAFIILVLILAGSQRVSLIIAAIVTFPMIETAVVSGIEHTSDELLEMAQVFCVSAWKKFRFIEIPHIMPFLKNSLQVSIGMCWKAGVSAEVIGLTKNTIGEQMYYAKVYLMISDLFAWSIAVVVCSYLCEKTVLLLIHILERK